MSPPRWSGRVRGRPPSRRAPRRRSLTGMSCGVSPHWPGVISRASGRRPLTGEVDLAGQTRPGSVRFPHRAGAAEARVFSRQLLEYFPALERAFDYAASKAALVLLTGYQTPAGLRRIGSRRLAAWLKNREVRGAQAMAAAQAQHTAVAGERAAAAVVKTLARAVFSLDVEIADIDAKITLRFREHRHAEVVRSMLGMGPLLGAVFIACTGGDMDAFGSAGRFAGVAGLAPVRCQGIRAGSAGTCADHISTTADSCGSSLSPPRSAPASAPPPRPSTTADEPRARPTNKRSSPSPAVVSMSYGPSSATNATGQPSHRNRA